MRHERDRERGRMDPIPPQRNEKHSDEKTSYTPAKPFQRKKLMLQLLTVAAVALAIAIGLSIFFKVDTVSVAGLEKYSYDSVREASGIQNGDSLLFFSRAEVSSKIMQKLPYIKSVRIGITLPGTVNIVVEEVEVAYAIQDNVGAWWLMSAEGIVLEQINGAVAADHTTIEGVTLVSPAVGEQAEAAEQTGNTPVTVTGEDRLAAALAVVQAMESNEILGEFTTVNVSSPYDLQLWYGTDYQFCLGEGSELNRKLSLIKACLPRILEDYPAGMLDVSNPDDQDFPFTKFD